MQQAMEKTTNVNQVLEKKALYYHGPREVYKGWPVILIKYRYWSEQYKAFRSFVAIKEGNHAVLLYANDSDLIIEEKKS